MAPKGNQFWKRRSKHGRDKIFEAPEILQEAAYEYFEWSSSNPWYINQVLQKIGDFIEVPTERPFTLTGLFVFLDIDKKTWDLYRQREDFIPVISRIEQIIYTQKFEGAAVGAFNANIISRDLGLIDKSENKNTTLNYNAELTPQEIKQFGKELEDEV